MILSNHHKKKVLAELIFKEAHGSPIILHSCGTFILNRECSSRNLLLLCFFFFSGDTHFFFFHLFIIKILKELKHLLFICLGYNAFSKSGRVIYSPKNNNNNNNKENNWKTIKNNQRQLLRLPFSQMTRENRNSLGRDRFEKPWNICLL